MEKHSAVFVFMLYIEKYQFPIDGNLLFNILHFIFQYIPIFVS